MLLIIETMRWTAKTSNTERVFSEVGKTEQEAVLNLVTKICRLPINNIFVYKNGCPDHSFQMFNPYQMIRDGGCVGYNEESMTASLAADALNDLYDKIVVEPWKKLRNTHIDSINE